MSKANFSCFTCGDVGHIAAECPRAGEAGTRNPPYCGFCDERSRQIDHGHSVSRCRECHPLRHQPLKQHRKCPHCHQTVYVWDNGDCGHHTGPHAPDQRPDRDHIDAVIATAR